MSSELCSDSGTQKVEYEIRCATPKDMKCVSQMLRDVVKQEKLPHCPKVTCEDLIRDGFMVNNPLYRCLVAQVCGGPIIGYVVYYYIFSARHGRVLQVDDLLVAKEHRCHGVGKALMSATCKQALENECNRVDIQIMECNPVRRFYEKFGACNVTKHELWCLYRLAGDHLMKAALEAC